jgi:hypothetical protein
MNRLSDIEALRSALRLVEEALDDPERSRVLAAHAAVQSLPHSLKDADRLLGERAIDPPHLHDLLVRLRRRCDVLRAVLGGDRLPVTDTSTTPARDLSCAPERERARPAVADRRRSG